MGAAELETRPLYGIGTVARLTRIRPETLRIWERRYGLGASQKAANGRRLYTQTDLEHLQIVTRLVEAGFRIGEIASMERKTLEAMMEQGGGSGTLSEAKPCVLFVGSALCSWLDQHPGCVSGLNSQLLRDGLDACSEELVGEVGTVDFLVVECAAINAEQYDQVLSLKSRLDAHSTLLFYQFSHQRLLAQLEAEGIATAKLPLNTEMFAAQMKRLQHGLEVDRGVADAGDLAAPRPRIFSDSALVEQQRLESVIACGCSQHLAGIIQSLANFETYSSNCSVENWSDAATHSCVYAYTNQARWLMEKALQAVLEAHEQHG